MSIVTRWRARRALRKRLEKTAKAEHVRAQEALEKARRKDLHPRQRLVLARDRASAKLRLRRRQVEEAERVLARHARPWVKRPQPERTRLSPNRSSRNGSRPRKIVLHITVSHNRPGLADIDGILSYLAADGTQASSHVINDREGHDARCVPDAEKAWTQAAHNPDSLSIEQIEYSDKRTREQWLTESRKQLENTALWCAAWSVAHDIPLVHSTTRGVCQHRDLGASGGGHNDCGPDYPIDWVLAKAREYAADLKRT